MKKHEENLIINREKEISSRIRKIPIYLHDLIKIRVKFFGHNLNYELSEE